MQWRKVREGWLVRFSHGEPVVEGILAFAREQRIEGAWVNMLGAMEEAEIGYYDLATKTYTRTKLEGDWEINGITGNLGWNGDTPVLHVHGSFGGRDFHVLGGHLFAGKAGATVEVFLRDLGIRLERKPDPDVGLALWSLTPE